MKPEVPYPIPVARLIALNPDNKVLILRRANTGYANRAWCLPGGKIGYGEAVETAAARELEEETALVGENLKFLFYQDSFSIKPGGMHCINLYLECSVNGEIRINRESDAFAWIGPGEIDSYDMAFRNDEALIRYWKTMR